MPVRSLGLAAVFTMFSVLPIRAHHSHGNYDLTTWTTMDGTVKEVHLLVPHSWIYLDVKDDKGQLTTWALRDFNFFDGWIVVVGAIACLTVAAAATRRRDWMILQFMGVVATGILANAFVCGALSSGDGRYQARIVWLIPFAAIVGAARVVRSRPTPLRLE